VAGTNTTRIDVGAINCNQEDIVPLMELCAMSDAKARISAARKAADRACAGISTMRAPMCLPKAGQ
jgi:hypothetical protein